MSLIKTLLFHTFCDTAAGGSSTQTCVDGVNVKMGPQAEGDKIYCMCINHLPDNKGHSQTFFSLIYNPAL